jgi:HD superfamily phosphodiesterase
MDPSREILTAETRFLAKLEEFFLFVFPETKLESHGLDHHRRVWAYAKELLSYPGTGTIVQKELLPHKLLIAAYLHDIGMVVDSGPKHGIHSRELCEEFLKKCKLHLLDHIDLLDAIENHDDKEYRTSQIGNPVLQILSVADDLDALSYIGIYRYIEIYLMRNVRHENLGDLILKNVTSRFKNLEKIYVDQPGYMQKHQPRYEAIKGFFNSYSKQAVGYKFGNSNPSEWCGIAELIGESVKKVSDLKELIRHATGNNYDNIIVTYFTNLRKELTS